MYRYTKVYKSIVSDCMEYSSTYDRQNYIAIYQLRQNDTACAVVGILIKQMIFSLTLHHIQLPVHCMSPIDLVGCFVHAVS